MVKKSRHNLYLPTKLYREIKRIAKENERSFNRQCVFFLVKAIEGDNKLISIRNLIEEIEADKKYIGRKDE